MSIFCRTHFKPLVVVSCFFVSCVAMGTAAEQAQAVRTTPVDTHPVSLSVNVTDDLGRPVSGLQQSDFQILEDKVRQPVVSFGRDDRPLSIGIVLDSSGTMAAALDRTCVAVADFLKTARPEDEAFLVEVGERPQIVTRMTRNFDEIQQSLANAVPGGRTALLDGVYLALNAMKKAQNPRHVLVVISDGVDNSSRYKATEIAGLIRETDVQISAIGVFANVVSRGRTPVDVPGFELLRYIAEPTGGRLFTVVNLAELPDVAAKIGIMLRSQYLVEYTPANKVRDGKYRKIAVQMVGQRGMHAFVRAGYIAPTQ